MHRLGCIALCAHGTHVSHVSDTPTRMSVPADSAVVILGPVPNAADSGVRGKASGAVARARGGGSA